MLFYTTPTQKFLHFTLGHLLTRFVYLPISELHTSKPVHYVLIFDCLSEMITKTQTINSFPYREQQHIYNQFRQLLTKYSNKTIMQLTNIPRTTCMLHKSKGDAIGVWFVLTFTVSYPQVT